ncbi:MAG TPA: hypothetical protein VGH27_10985 [Streptosporangiaceae bacterium]|jgi:hypothetical protein
MEAVRTLADWAPHESRPGRGVLVIADLRDLTGPTQGTVELPIWLYWSPPGQRFDLTEPYRLQSMYQTVLGEAHRPQDLTSYLDRDTLIALWPVLFLPKGVRRAWEERHPVLRTAAAAA